MEDTLMLKVLPSTTFRIRNFQNLLLNFMGSCKGTAQKINLESQFHIIIAKTTDIKNKIGAIESGSQSVSLNMETRKTGKYIQMIGNKNWNNIELKVTIDLFEQIQDDFEKKMEIAKKKIQSRMFNLTFRIFEIMLESRGTKYYMIKNIDIGSRQEQQVTWMDEQTLHQKMNADEAKDKLMNVKLQEPKVNRQLPDTPMRRNHGVISSEMENFYKRAERHDEGNHLRGVGFSFGSPGGFNEQNHSRRVGFSFGSPEDYNEQSDYEEYNSRGVGFNFGEPGGFDETENYNQEVNLTFENQNRYQGKRYNDRGQNGRGYRHLTSTHLRGGSISFGHKSRQNFGGTRNRGFKFIRPN